MLFACENIDRLQCMELQGRALPRGLKMPLYELVRAAHDEPLVLAAARLLNQGPRHIGIVTGAAVPGHMPVGENDGPIGASVLAKALLVNNKACFLPWAKHGRRPHALTTLSQPSIVT